ncbi:hypothetical protein [Parahaliea mediterranea]|uniref:hypothetical protein n=1 Tax=Parahaliea mediterranea TaxID=651086 RepID=UPI000E2EC338|nr:hypothetical protein [Parahaliea mediterranea]
MADPAWSDVKSLNHWDGADGATASPDQVAGVSWTFFGDARLEGSRGVFGSSAALECGGTNATGRVVGTGIPDFGTANFAIQFTIQGNANASARVLFDQRPSSTNGNYLLVYVDASNKLGIYVNGTQLYTSGGNIFTGSVRQIGIKRISGSVQVWIDNSQDGAGFALAASLSVGANGTHVGGSAFNPGTQAMAAWLDELRIVTGASADIDLSVAQSAPWPNEPSVPVLTNPAGTAAGPNSADWSVNTDGDTGTIYVIASQSTTKPSAPQIKAGEDHTGSPATWSTNQPVTTTGTQSGTATGLSAGTWYFHFLWNDGSGDSAVVTSNSFTLEAGWAITQQPVNTTVYAYDNAEFRVVVSDPTGTATFQWYRVESGGNTPIASETTDVLVIASAALDDDGSQYLCVASRAGEADLTTNVVTLTVVARSTQVLPGSLHGASYPSFFPCATWQFDQQIGPEVARTRFSSGWTRQRKQWREEVSTGTLSFSMPTTMFDNWSRWMMNNGYQWFTLLLDRFFGVRALYEVRLTSRIDWKYRNYNVVDAVVRFELGAVVNSGEWDGLPDTETPPDFGPDDKPPGIENRPECEPYSCSAYESAMRDGLGLEYFPLYSPSDDTWEFPFSGPSQLRACIGFGWPGALQSNWAGSSNGFIKGTPLAWQQADSAPVFCNGEVRQCAMINYVPGNGIPGIFPPLARWGSMSVGAIVTGLASSMRISGTFMSARDNYLFPGGYSTASRADCRFTVTADLGGGVVSTGLQIQTYVLGETETLEIDLGFVGDKWLSAAASVRIYPLEVVSEEGGLITFKSTVEAAMSLGAGSLRKTHTAFYVSSGYPTGINESGNQNCYFYGANLSFMNLAGEFFNEDIDIIDVAGIAFDRNHPDYVPPGYCNI